MTFAIAGVTGRTGRTTAESLLSQGQKVRVIVRDASKASAWKQRGAEIAVADVGDPKALAQALSGAQGAWLLLPPNMAVHGFRAWQRRTVESMATAVQASGIRHVAFLSSIGAQHDAGTGPIVGLHLAEKAFSEIQSCRFSFVRAAYFMENLTTSLGMLEQGILPSFTPASLSFDMIASADIGGLAASLLTEGTERNQIVELGGPPRSMNEVADTLSAITGKKIRVQEAPLDAMVPTLTGFGIPEEIAQLYREMTEGIVSGHVAFEGEHRRQVGTLSLREVLGDILAANR
jgi:uncharacterized protein YbjT (DUF2867 family)